MNVRHTLICFFFLSGNTGLITEGIPIITVQEGGTIRHQCKFIFSGRKRALYKKDNLLIQTYEDTAKHGRYSIRYTSGTSVLPPVLHVSITNLIKSDSGQYKCVLGRWFDESTEKFEIRVKDAPTTLKPTTQSLSCSSESATPSPTSIQTTVLTPATRPGSIFQSESTTTFPEKLASCITCVQLYVRLIPVVMIFVLSAAVLLSFSKMACEPEEPPVETVNDTETEAEWSKVTYFVVAASFNSAPHGYADNVSVPQVAEHASSPLYSTVIYHRQYLQRCQCHMCTRS